MFRIKQPLGPLVSFPLIFASFFLIVMGFYFSKPILVPLLFASFIAFIFSFPMLWIEKKIHSFPLSLFITISTIFFGGVLLFLFLHKSLQSLSHDLSLFQDKIPDILKNFQNFFSRRNWTFLGIDLKEKIDMSIFLKKFFSLTVFNGLASLLKQSFLIFLLVFFILLEIPLLSSKMENIFSLYNLPSKTFQKFMDSFRSYMFIKALSSLITASLIGGALFIFNVPYCVLWTVLAFFLNFIPNIGSVLAALPPIVLTLFQDGGQSAFFIFLIYVIVNFFVSSVLEPKWMGKELGLSTLVVFLSFVSWGTLLGTVGMILAVPLTVMIKIACESHTKTKWIAILLSNRNDLFIYPNSPEKPQS